jgi:hypothetical protein
MAVNELAKRVQIASIPILSHGNCLARSLATPAESQA